MIHLTPEQLSKLVNIAIASLRINSIKLPHKEIRSNIHIIMYGRIGSTKSTILYDVAGIVKGNVMKGLTKANLYGIVDKDGETILPAIWDCRHNFLMIDEYFLDRKDTHKRELLNELLSVMENPEYSKKISFKARDVKLRNKGLHCIINKGMLCVKTRFSLFMNTMLDIEHSGIHEIQALMSRCLCIPVYPDIATLDKIADGICLYKYEYIKIPKKDVVITDDVYQAIKSFIKNGDVNETNYLRRLGDLCRVYAVLGKIDEDVFNLILSLP